MVGLAYCLIYEEPAMENYWWENYGHAKYKSMIEWIILQEKSRSLDSSNTKEPDCRQMIQQSVAVQRCVMVMPPWGHPVRQGCQENEDVFSKFVKEINFEFSRHFTVLRNYSKSLICYIKAKNVIWARKFKL